MFLKKKKKKGSFLTGFQLPAGYFQNTYLITGSLVLLVLSVDVVGSLCDVVCKFWIQVLIIIKKKKKTKVIFTTFLQLNSYSIYIGNSIGSTDMTNILTHINGC